MAVSAYPMGDRSRNALRRWRSLRRHRDNQAVSEFIKGVMAERARLRAAIENLSYDDEGHLQQLIEELLTDEAPLPAS